jgi:hypothetical protein
MVQRGEFKGKIANVICKTKHGTNKKYSIQFNTLSFPSPFFSVMQ